MNLKYSELFCALAWVSHIKTLTFRHLLVKINGSGDLYMEHVLNRMCFHIQPQEGAKEAASISGESYVAAQHYKNHPNKKNKINKKHFNFICCLQILLFHQNTYTHTHHTQTFRWPTDEEVASFPGV